jgi:hypothetical protein
MAMNKKQISEQQLVLSLTTFGMDTDDFYMWVFIFYKLPQVLK